MGKQGPALGHQVSPKTTILFQLFNWAEMHWLPSNELTLRKQVIHFRNFHLPTVFECLNE